jgi:hypothetical protein
MTSFQLVFRRRAAVRVHQCRRPERIMILSGSTVRTENVQLLAGMLDGDELAMKLERAVANKNTIVALSLDDRHRITAVLADDPPWGLAQLQGVLVKQLKQHKDREAQDLRVRLNRERALRQSEPLD